MKTQQSEKGQVLVLILLGAVALFGFAALAIDLGQLFNARRNAQSAADSAALSAASASVDGLNVVNAGLGTAAINGFDNNGTTNTVVINNPPTGGTPYDGDDEYFQVIIWEEVAPIFGHFIFLGSQETTVSAIARVTSANAMSAGNAVHALSVSGTAVELNGNTTINITGGNIFSNGGGVKNGGSGKVRVYSGGILIAKDNGWVCNGCNTQTVQPQAQDTGIDPQWVNDVPAPYCPTKNETHNGVNYYYYPSGISSGMTLQPGIHCVKGDIKLSGNGANLTGKNVLIVMLTGGMKNTGNSNFDVHRANSIIDKNGNQYGGMLIYAPKTNTNVFAIGGNGNAIWSGTILAPGAACELGGTSSTKAIRSAVICNTVKIHGNPDFNLTYLQPENYQLPPTIALIN